MYQFFLKLRDIAPYTTPVSLVFGVLGMLFSIYYSGGPGFHILGLFIIAAWLFIPALSWWAFMPKENPLSFLVSIYPVFLKLFTLIGTAVLLSIITIFTLTMFVRWLVVT
jgi:hypothetical protein